MGSVKDEKNYYFSVYNADSIPNKNTIKEVLETINENDDVDFIYSDEDKIYVQNVEKLMDKLNIKYNSQIF